MSNPRTDHYIDAYHDDPKPFLWTASVASILERVNRCLAVCRTDHTWRVPLKLDGSFMR